MRAFSIIAFLMILYGVQEVEGQVDAGHYQVIFELVEVCATGELDAGTGEEFRWRTSYRRSEDFLYRGHKVYGLNESSSQVCFSGISGKSVGSTLPSIILKESFNFNIAPSPVLHLKLEGYEKDCQSTNSYNGDDLNYNRECFCGPLGSLRCYENDDDNYRQAEVPVVIQAADLTPGVYETVTIELPGKTASDYTFKIRYTISPPIPNVAYSDEELIVCAGENTLIKTNYPWKVSQFIWYENQNFETVKICDEIDPLCLNQRNIDCNNCSGIDCEKCACQECLDQKSDDQCLLECNVCLICHDEYIWREIGVTQSPELLITHEKIENDQETRQYRLSVIGENGFESVSPGPLGAITTVLRGAATVSHQAQLEAPPINLNDLLEESEDISIVHVNCNGENNGTIEIKMLDESISGAGRYNIRLYGPDRTQLIENLSTTDLPQRFEDLMAGSYFLRLINVVEGMEYCFSESTLKVKEPHPLSLQITDPFINNRGGYSISCKGGNDGHLEFSSYGGIGAHTYFINGKELSNNYAEGLLAGMVEVSVIDQSGCSVQSSYLLTEPSEINFSTIPFPINNAFGHAIQCFGESAGKIQGQVAGGVAPYSVSVLSPSDEVITISQQGDFLISNLPSGEYEVSATDKNGCKIKYGGVFLSQPAPLKATVISANPPSCPGAGDGSLSLLVEGGNGSLTTKLKDITKSGINIEYLNLSSGIYPIQLLDQLGCEYQSEFEVPENNNPIKITQIQTKNPDCHDTSNGSIHAILTGGTPPYLYTLNGSVYQSVNGDYLEIEGLQGRVQPYEITVIDSNFERLGGFCSLRTSVLIAAPKPISVTSAISQISCYGNRDGSIQITPLGGTPPYTVEWTTLRQINPIIDQMGPGTYPFVIHDINSCEFTSQITLEEPDVLQQSSIEVKSESCDGMQDGTVFLTAVGGRSPYQYKLNDKINSTGYYDGLSNGLAVWSVIDDSGCEITGNISVPIMKPIYSLDFRPVACGSQEFELMVEVEGFYASSRIFLDGEEIQAGQPNRKMAGFSQLLFELPNGCKYSETIELAYSGPMLASIETVRPSTCGLEDGEAMVSVSNATEPIFELWKNEFGETIDKTRLSNGFYTVELTDAVGCEVKLNYFHPAITELKGTAIIQSKPNCGQMNGQVELVIEGGSGLYSVSWDGKQGGLNATNLSEGEHIITVTDLQENCVIRFSFYLTPDAPIFVSTEISEPDCELDNGTVHLDIIGGSAPYTVTWNDGFIGSDRNNMGAGLYTFEVKDSKGCTHQENLSVNSKSNMRVIITQIHSPTCGLPDGGFDFVIEGSDGPFTIKLNEINLEKAGSVQGLTEGNYILSVTDENGCISFKTIRLIPNEDLFPKISFFNISASACDQPTGGFSFAIEGSTGPYEVLWGDQSPIFQNEITKLHSGSYSFDVIDNNGCRHSNKIVIPKEKSPIPLFETLAPPLCKGEQSEVSVYFPDFGDDIIYIEWDGGNPTLEYNKLLNPGWHTIRSYSQGNCKGELIPFEVPDSPPFLPEFTLIEYPGCTMDGDGRIEVLADDGWQKVMWNSVEVVYPFTGTGLQEGTNIFEVIDKNGCNQKFTVDLPFANGLTATPIIVAPSCPYSNDGTLSWVVTGGTSPYLFEGMEQQNDGLSQGLYQIMISDYDGCEILVEANIMDPTPERLPLLPDTVTLCQGRPFEYNIGLWQNVVWESSNQIIGKEPFVSFNSEGNLIVKVLDTNGCWLQDSVWIRRDIGYFDFDFLVPTIVEVGDTVVAVDITTPYAEKAQWHLPSGTRKIQESLHMVSFITDNEASDFTVGLSVETDGCFSYGEKTLEVRTPSARLPYSKQLLEVAIKSDLFPNPNNGKFRLEVESETPNSLNLIIIDAQTGRVIEHRKESRKIKHEIDISIENETNMALVAIQINNQTLIHRVFLN